MKRRGFFGTLSAGLAFLGIGTASRSAAASPTDGAGPAMAWQQVEERVQYHHYETLAAGMGRRIEVLEGWYRDWWYEAQITYCHPVAGPYYVFEVAVGSDGVGPEDAEPLRANSWGNSLEEVRARAEVAIKLFLDVKRLENEAVRSGWPGFRLLSTIEDSSWIEGGK